MIVAGSDLFTGNTMVMAVGYLQGRSSGSDLLRVWGWSWVGNLVGSALVAGLAVGAGTFAADPSLLVDVAHAKTTRPPDELFFRAILCNWLVTLAVWSAIKVEDEVAKLVMIWWCLLAFIGSGYEHSVANMTVLTMGNLVPNGGAVTWAGTAYNLAVVTAGNVVSGAVMMGAAYWFVTNPEATATAAGDAEAAPVGADD